MRNVSRYPSAKLFLCLALLAMCAAVGAQAFSHVLSFQGRLADADTGKPVPDGQYDVTFTIYDAETEGDALWQETQTVDQVGGVFNVYLGSVTPFPDDLFSGGDRWLALQVAEDDEMAERFRFTPSPWSLYSATSGTDDDWAFSGDDIYRDSGNVGIGITDPDYPLHVETSTSRAVFGESTTSAGIGVHGLSSAFSGGGYGVYGENYSTTGVGVIGIAAMTSGANYGVYGQSQSSTGRGVYGLANTATGVNYGVYGKTNSSEGYAGYFEGDVRVSGYLYKDGGGFQIEHPLDPENKYLYHSFVESPDMKNVYDGVAVLDAGGEAWVELPEWFEALNRDFRYQLTCIGGFAPVYIAEEISGSLFKIAGGEPGLKVSWQVTGIRHDAYANAHRIAVEEDKPQHERGRYLHPDLYGQPDANGICHDRRGK